MMRREGGLVIVHFSEEQFQNLQVLLGYAMASSMLRADGDSRDRDDDVQMVLRTINMVHEGDETFTPYEVLEN